MIVVVMGGLFTDKKFLAWFKDNSTPFGVFVVLGARRSTRPTRSHGVMLAGTNVDVLNVLCSRILNLKFLRRAACPIMSVPAR